jgi:hypothetical protein
LEGADLLSIGSSLRVARRAATGVFARFAGVLLLIWLDDKYFFVLAGTHPFPDLFTVECAPGTHVEIRLVIRHGEPVYLVVV